jgi:uncharacterized protein YjiS (DUF1127 family)
MERTMIDARMLAISRRDVSARRKTVRLDALRRLIAWFTTERRIRRTIDELSELDNDMLSDIGLTRGEIEHAVRYGRYREQAAVTSDVAAQTGATDTKHNARLEQGLRDHG